jgi:protein-S-isoprenylcysteine O-methyltransferase Ste14
MAAPAPVPATQPSSSRLRRALTRIIGVLYGLVMIEVVIMISPFAFYFYSAYGPTQRWLDHWPATAWLTGFMLPHAVFTTSPVLEFFRWDFGRYAFGLGLLGFFFFAGQIYIGKLVWRGKAITSWGYRYVRHPQYLCLSLAALGLLTMWPRMVIFLLFIGMLVAYYALARVEEQRMLSIDPTYADYMRRTGMFLPGNPGGRIYRALFGRMSNQRRARLLAGIGAAVVLLAAGIAARAYTISHVSKTTVAVFSPGAQPLPVIAVYPQDAQSLSNVVQAALGNEEVRQALAKEGNAQFVAHVLPHDYGMVGMFADIGQHHMRPGNVHLSGFKYLIGLLLPFTDMHIRTAIMGADQKTFRVVFSRVDTPSGQPVAPDHLFDLSAKMTPVYIADVGPGGQVTRTIDPPRRSYWGKVKMPIF